MLISRNDNNKIDRPKPFFLESIAQEIENWLDNEKDQHSQHVVYRVARKPQNLEAHLARIYHSYRNHDKEHLFAALLDLLIILGDRGKDLARRFIFASTNKLDANQVNVLNHWLENHSSRQFVLANNPYSLFSKGLLSKAVLINIAASEIKTAHDPLQLARDYIQFSQIKDAINTLEEAIIATPDRIELHEELLALYQSTRDHNGFERMFKALSATGITLPDGWRQLNDFFGNKQA